MSIFVTNFSEYTVDEAPPDWTEQWHTTTTVPTIRAGVAGLGILSGKYLELLTSSAERYAISWNVPGTPTDVESLALINGSNESQSQELWRFFVRGSGSSTAETAYILIPYGNVINNYVRINSYLNTTSATVNDLTSFNTDANIFYWNRFRVIGTLLKWKIWQFGTMEPLAWHMEVYNSTVGTAGWVGFGCYYTGTIKISYFAVSDNGESIAVPSGLIKVGGVWKPIISTKIMVSSGWKDAVLGKIKM